MAQGRLSAPGLAQLVAVGRRRARPGVLRRASSSSTRSRRDILFEGLSAIPGVFLRKPEGASTSWPGSPCATARTSRRWLLTDFQRDGATVMVAPAPRLLRDARARHGRGAHRLRAEGGRPQRGGRHPRPSAPAYARARGLEHAPAAATRRGAGARLPRAGRELTATGVREMPDPIRVTGAVVVPASALAVAFTRSSGPGGQNVTRSPPRSSCASTSSGSKDCATTRVRLEALTASRRDAAGGCSSPASARVTSTGTSRTLAGR